MQTLSAPSVKDESITYEACGFHLMLTLKGCDPEILNNPAKLEELTRAAAIASRATVLQICTHQFQPQGVTSVAILAESHASLHTYPEHNIVFWDCFTCSADCAPELSIPVLVEALNPESFSQEMIYRH